MPVYYVYLLKCKNRTTNRISLYTGSTQDLMKRVNQHQMGKGAQYTKGKDLELVYFETHLSRSAAMKREYEIKSYTTEQKWNLVNNFQKQVQNQTEEKAK